MFISLLFSLTIQCPFIILLFRIVFEGSRYQHECGYSFYLLLMCKWYVIFISCNLWCQVVEGNCALILIDYCCCQETQLAYTMYLCLRELLTLVGELYELDGRKAQPISHGSSSPSSLLQVILFFSNSKFLWCHLNLLILLIHFIFQ